MQLDDQKPSRQLRPVPEPDLFASFTYHPEHPDEHQALWGQRLDGEKIAKSSTDILQCRRKRRILHLQYAVQTVAGFRMDIKVQLYQPKRYARWECHIEKAIHLIMGDCLYFTGDTREAAIEAMKDYLTARGVEVGNVIIEKETALYYSASEQALNSYREKGGDMPADTYLNG